MHRPPRSSRDTHGQRAKPVGVSSALLAATLYALKLKLFDFLHAGVFVLLALVWAVFCYSLPALDLDLAEQVWEGSAVSCSGLTQPPLYGWMTSAIIHIAGMNRAALTAAKFVLLAVFYVAFYLLARRYWAPRKSLLATITLLLLRLYGLTTPEHLTHSLLVSLLAVLCFHVIVGILREPGRTGLYLTLGVLSGLGMLAKYSFVLVALALLCAGVSSRSTRGVFWNPRLLMTIAVALAICLPMISKAIAQHSGSTKFGLDALSISLSSPEDAQSRIHGILAKQTYVNLIEPAAFIVLMVILFHRDHQRLQDSLHRTAAWFFARTLAWAAAFIAVLLVSPLTPMVNPWWLAPVLFLAPLTLFFFIRVEEGTWSFGAKLMVALVLLLLGSRMVTIRYSALTGMADYRQIPFPAIASQLRTLLESSPSTSGSRIVVIGDDLYLLAHLRLLLPEVQVVPSPLAYTLHQQRRLRRNQPASVRDAALQSATPKGRTRLDAALGQISTDGPGGETVVYVWQTGKASEGTFTRYMAKLGAETTCGQFRAPYSHSTTLVYEVNYLVMQSPP